MDLKSGASKCFGEYVSDLLLRADFHQFEDLVIVELTDEMLLELKMFVSPTDLCRSHHGSTGSIVLIQ